MISSTGSWKGKSICPESNAAAGLGICVCPFVLSFLIRKIIMLIATWNVNSVRSRIPRLIPWLQQEQPDIVCLQEIKCTEEQFPFKEIEQAGYSVILNAQKTYNGVAILSRMEPDDVQVGFEYWDDTFNGKSCARLLSGWYTDDEGRTIRVVNCYVPVGDEPGTEKAQYKLDWYDALLNELLISATPDDEIVLVGDLNVFRSAIDAKSPQTYEGGPLGYPLLREKFNSLLKWGFHDVFRELYPQKVDYSWYDYRSLGFERKDGLRIDYILATRPTAARFREVKMEIDMRAGEKPSDHLPVVGLLE